MREMDLDRFAALIAAYGAAPTRWPDEERAAADTFARTDRRAAALLTEANAIAALLFAHEVAEPARTLRLAGIAAAAARRRLVRRVRLWWSGLAMALAAGSGLLAGSAAMAALEPTSTLSQIYVQNEMAVYDDPAEENAP